MDKIKTLEKILQKILDFKKHKFENTEYISTFELDRIILESCEVLDRNLQYEFKNYLKAFEFISQEPLWIGAKKAGFVIYVETIKKQLKIMGGIINANNKN